MAKIKVMIERDWDYLLPFRVCYNDSRIYFSTFDCAVNYCKKHGWEYDYDDMLDL